MRVIFTQGYVRDHLLCDDNDVEHVALITTRLANFIKAKEDNTVLVFSTIDGFQPSMKPLRISSHCPM
jgi:hypothetical protein